MSEAEFAAIQARVAYLLPLGYVVTALSAAHTPEQVDTLTQVLYTDVPALLAEVGRLRAGLVGLQRSHDCCPSCLFACPRFQDVWDGAIDDRDPCTCGADEHNAALDALLVR